MKYGIEQSNDKFKEFLNKVKIDLSRSNTDLVIPENK